MRERQVRGRSGGGDYAAVVVRVRGGPMRPNHPKCDQEGAIVCENGRCVGGARRGMLMQWWAWAWGSDHLAWGQQDATVCEHVTRAGR